MKNLARLLKFFVKNIAAHINIDIIINFTNEFKSFLSSRRQEKKTKK